MNQIGSWKGAVGMQGRLRATCTRVSPPANQRVLPTGATGLDPISLGGNPAVATAPLKSGNTTSLYFSGSHGKWTVRRDQREMM